MRVGCIFIPPCFPVSLAPATLAAATFRLFRERSRIMPDDVKILSQMADMPVTVTGLDHVVLRVTDMDRAISFYGDVLGCPVERRLESIGLVQLRAGTSMIDLVPCGPDDAPGVS